MIAICSLKLPPESTTDYLQEFGLDKRNPSATDLTGDNKTLH
jgi:hypothetical protein